MNNEQSMTVKSEAEKPKKEDEKNAHVIAKINDDYYKTSKVVIPKDVKSKKLQKCFEQLKRDFTYESQKNVVTVSYIDVNEKYSFERRQVISVEIEESNTDPKQHKSIYLHDRQIKDIKKALPNSFVFYNVSTAIFYHKKEDYLSKKQDEQTIHLKIEFDKTTKKEFSKGDDL